MSGYSSPSPRITAFHTTASTQAVTPLDGKRTRYIFTVALRQDEPVEWLEIFREITLAAFAEDKQMIEAQQVMIDRTSHLRLAATAQDEAAVRIRRMVEAAAR